jgi:hypothetical protein
MDSRICQTFAASPAQPGKAGDLPLQARGHHNPGFKAIVLAVSTEGNFPIGAGFMPSSREPNGLQQRGRSHAASVLRQQVQTCQDGRLAESRIGRDEFRGSNRESGGNVDEVQASYHDRM